MEHLFARSRLAVLLSGFALLSACDALLLPVAIVASPFAMAAEQGRIRQDVEVVDVSGKVIATSGRQKTDRTETFQTNANTIVCRADHKANERYEVLGFRCNKGLSAVGEALFEIPVLGGASSFSIGVGTGVPAIDSPRIWDTRFTSVCAANFNPKNGEALLFAMDCGRDTTTFDFARQYKNGLGRKGMAAVSIVPVSSDQYRTTVWINLVK